MPISKKDFENGKPKTELTKEIISFLKDRKDRAFTSQEIMEGINYHTEFTTPEISKISTFTIADFTSFLYHLAEKGQLMIKIAKGRIYVMMKKIVTANCPKCGGKVNEPKKTWKMAGRPNKKGERLELQIGLYECPKHRAFRKVVNKQKIPA